MRKPLVIAAAGLSLLAGVGLGLFLLTRSGRHADKPTDAQVDAEAPAEAQTPASVKTPAAAKASASTKVPATAKGSATASAPAKVSQVAQIRAKLAGLRSLKGSNYLSITGKGGRGVVQIPVVDFEGSVSYSLRLAYYPSRDTPTKALSSAGITLPSRWQLLLFSPQNSAQFSVPEEDIDLLPGFIDDIFTKFYKYLPDYELDFAFHAS